MSTPTKRLLNQPCDAKSTARLVVILWIALLSVTYSATHAAEAKKKLNVSAEDRRAAQQEFEQQHGFQVKQARKSVQKSQLAQFLFQSALETKDDPNAKYTLLRNAVTLAVQAGDLGSALQVRSIMAEEYSAEIIPNRLALAVQAANTVRTPQANAVLTNLCAELIDSAVAEDQFDVMEKLADIAADSAKKSRNRALLKDMLALIARAESVKGKYEQLGVAQLSGRAPSANASRNVDAGKYHCFIKDDWNRGLPFFAKGSDPRLKLLATLELSKPESTKAHLQLGDGWSQIAEHQADELIKTTIQKRAAAWYELAIPELDESKRTVVEEKFMSLFDEEEGIIVHGDVALSSRGATVQGCEVGSKGLMDGDTSAKTLAYSPCPCDWLVQLSAVYSLQELRLHLMNNEYQYTLATSVDGKNFLPLVNRSKGTWSGLQTIRFRRRPVRFIRITGLNSSHFNMFHLPELEAFCTTETHPLKSGTAKP